MTDEFNFKTIILIVVLGILVFVGLFLINTRSMPGENNLTPPNINQVGLLDDYSRFFTVSNSANTYINNLARGNVENLMILLSDDYIQQNNLTEENVLYHLDELPGYFYNFTARKIYQYPLSDNIIRYYIYGHLREKIINELPPAEDYYLILIFDTSNFTFSIIPYDGTRFKEANNG